MYLNGPPLHYTSVSEKHVHCLVPQLSAALCRPGGPLTPPVAAAVVLRPVAASTTPDPSVDITTTPGNPTISNHLNNIWSSSEQLRCYKINFMSPGRSPSSDLPKAKCRP